MFGIFKKFAKILDKKQQKKLIILFCVTLIGTFLEVLSVSTMVPVIRVLMDENIMTSNQKVMALCETFHIESYISFVTVCILILIAIFVFKEVFVVLQNYLQVKFVCNNRMAMQQKLLGIIIRRPYEYFLNVKTGEITQIVIRDPNSAYSLLLTVLSMVTDVIVSISLGITVFVISPLITGIVVAVILVCLVVILKVAKPTIQDVGVTFRKSNSTMSSWVIQIVNGIKAIKVTNREKFFEDEFKKINDKGIKAERTYKSINIVPRALIEMVSVCSALLAILIMITGGKSLTDLFPALSAFAVAAIKLLPCANKISNAINEVSYQRPYLDKMIENLENLEGSYNFEFAKEGGEPIYLNEGIEIKDLSFSYSSSDKKIFDGANMVIPAGKSVGIVGPSGAGKTTVVDIILGLLKQQEGTICSDGNNVMENYLEWLTHIGYIPQTIFVLDGTVRDNIVFGADAEVNDELVWKAVREAQLEDFVNSLPDGLDSMVGERGLKISGGQRQRLGIARALYSDPDLLIFDEATSSLDNDTEAAIMDSINSLHGKKTMIIIAHRLQTIEGCDMVYKVSDGKITRER